MTKQGMVYLVGAGPGDIELLTVKAQRLLKKADVVIFDRLVNPFLLADLKTDVKLIYCGKQPCKHLLRQEDIQTEMILHAKKGKTVVRLKGGDPSVFGRVGEEAESLKKNGITFEIVPGVTSGTAASIYAGVPVTHRDHSGSFAVVTAHRKTEDGKPDVNWKSLAQSVDTILFYMGIKKLHIIADELIKNGKSKNTPVLVVQWGTYSRQKSVEGTLSTITDQVNNHNIENPAMIMVGDVIQTRQQVSWFEQKPMSGMSILIPSKTKENHDLAEKLSEQGADVYVKEVCADSQNFIDKKDMLQMIDGNREIIFSNMKSFKHFLRQLGNLNIDFRTITNPLFALNSDIQLDLKQLGLLLPLYQKKRADRPYFIDSMTRMRELKMNMLVALTRALEEGHVNSIICTSKEDVQDIIAFLNRAQIGSLESITFIATSKQIEDYARTFHLNMKVIQDVEGCFSKMASKREHVPIAVNG
ncbi:uroporphyrinogen-III methylase [Bacillus sp. TS-2]|nr:uroporphyrinogen-III methylase [Bacillus sp. TS-2]